jgi:hypothetical protein
MVDMVERVVLQRDMEMVERVWVWVGKERVRVWVKWEKERVIINKV